MATSQQLPAAFVILPTCLGGVGLGAGRRTKVKDWLRQQQPRPLARPLALVLTRATTRARVTLGPRRNANGTGDCHQSAPDSDNNDISRTISDSLITAGRERRRLLVRRLATLCLSVGLFLLRRPEATAAAEAAGQTGSIQLFGAGWWKPFGEAFTVISMSAFGDKSWFAIALLAMKHQASMVLIGALSALTVMTGIACFLGKLMHALDSRVTWVLSIFLFLVFGIQMLLQSRTLPSKPGGDGGEYQDAEGLVREFKANKASPSTVIGKIFSLIMVAEWMDRSMVSTMVLAASGSTTAVLCGAMAANVATSGCAVLGASLLAARVSERVVAIVAGVLFNIFALQTFFEGPA